MRLSRQTHVTVFPPKKGLGISQYGGMPATRLPSCVEESSVKELCLLRWPGLLLAPPFLTNSLSLASHAAAQVQLQMSQEALSKSEERLRAAARERQGSVEGRSRR